MISKKPLFLYLCAGLVLAGCNNSRFQVEKRFWTPEDYSNVLWEIEYKTPEGEAYPRFSDPETSLVIRKLVDHQNYDVLLDDTELGLNYRSEVSQEFFDQSRDLSKIYTAMDIQDRYVYPEELIEAAKFSLGVQLKYFRLGNDRIIEQADDPQAERVTGVLRSNEQTIVNNFTSYLDHFGEEKYFGHHAHLLADVVNDYFFRLIEAFPNANYGRMLDKAKLVLKKAEAGENKSALEKLIRKIESMKVVPDA